MISKNLRIGMKVVPISKSVGQNFHDWKSQYLRNDKFITVIQFVGRGWNYWVCRTQSGGFVGNFLAKDLVEYQE